MFHVAEGPSKPIIPAEYPVLDNLGFRNGKRSCCHGVRAHMLFQLRLRPISDGRTSSSLWMATVEYWLNGVKTAEYEMHSPEWNEQIANAKFKNWELYATTGKGTSVSGSGHRIWF